MSYAQININQNTLKYIFPYLKNKYLFNYLKIDNDSIHYISHKNISAKISSIIENHLSKYNINKKNAIITDCTAGVGGDSICLAQNFFDVIQSPYSVFHFSLIYVQSGK
jgi:hypothetical protein